MKAHLLFFSWDFSSWIVSVNLKLCGLIAAEDVRPQHLAINVDITHLSNSIPDPICSYR